VNGGNPRLAAKKIHDPLSRGSLIVDDKYVDCELSHGRQQGRS
jgi:hypothetical protein